MMNDWAHMEVFGFGLGHWLIFVMMVALILYPIGRILHRMGFLPFWSVATFVALFNIIAIIALWLFALIDWPEKTTVAR